MSETPGDGPDEQNPFKGTPFEQLFSGMAGGLAGRWRHARPEPADEPDAGVHAAPRRTGQLGRRHRHGPQDLRPGARPHADPGPARRGRGRRTPRRPLARRRHRLPLRRHHDGRLERAEWIVETTDVWKRLVEPIAGSAVGALGNALPEEARAMAGPLLGMLGKATGAMVATQVGQGVGALSAEVLGASDIGLPLGPDGKAALLPGNVEKFAAELDVSADDVLLYLALREAAHQRLFANAPWLREHLIGAVTAYGEGIEINTAGIEEKLARDRPDQPGGHAVGDGGRALRPRQVARPAGRAGAPRDHPGTGRGLGRRGRLAGHRDPDAQRREAAGDRTPPPRRRWSGRGDLRRARRPRAAPPPPPRRLHAVGLAADPPGHRGPRRRVDAPRPAADRGRPRRPARVPRGRRDAGVALRRGLRRRAARAARRPATPRRRRRPAE